MFPFPMHSWHQWAKIQAFSGVSTRKAARKKGFITFEGELLLMGKHDATVISVTPEGASAEPAAAPATGGYVDAPAEAPAVRKASKSSNRSDDSSKFHVDMSYLGRISRTLCDI